METFVHFLQHQTQEKLPFALAVNFSHLYGKARVLPRCLFSSNLFFLLFKKP